MAEASIKPPPNSNAFRVSKFYFESITNSDANIKPGVHPFTSWLGDTITENDAPTKTSRNKWFNANQEILGSWTSPIEIVSFFKYLSIK